MSDRDPLLQRIEPKNLQNSENTGYNPELSKHLNSSLDKLFSDFDIPQGNDFAPNSKYNVTEESQIDRGEAVFQNNLTNAYNSFRDGMIQTQISTIKGKMLMTKFGQYGLEYTVLNAPNVEADLKKQLEQGLISQEEFNSNLSELKNNVEESSKQLHDYQAEIKTLEDKVQDYPVSKEYIYNQALVQSEGDTGSALAKLVYSAPNTIGSSASLMVPHLAATFGSKLTNTLITAAAKGVARAAGANILGPEVAIPIEIISTIGTVGTAVFEHYYGRLQETYGEVAEGIEQSRSRLIAEYMETHDLHSPDEIPEEDLRQIKLKSYEGSKLQFQENMSLVASDIAQSMLMPLGNLGTGLSKLTKITKDLSRTYEAAKDYNKATRLLSTAGNFYKGSMLEGYEEGLQYVAQQRKEGTSINPQAYQNEGFLSAVLSDGYNTVSSLNYSPIPGLDVRGGGKYSQDKEFQFATNSGAMLSYIMGGIPTALSISKDLIAYKKANKDLQETGVQDIDGKYKRLQNSILVKYFDNDQVHHLGEAIKSLVGKVDATTNQPILTQEDAVKLFKDIKETYDVYKEVSPKVDAIGRGKLDLGFTSVNLDNSVISEAKNKLKEDYLDAIIRNKEKVKENEQLEISAKLQYAKDQELYETDNPIALSARQEFEAKIEAIKSLEEKIKILEKNHNSQSGLFASHSLYTDALKNIENVKADLEKAKEDFKDAPEELSKNYKFETSQAYKDIVEKIMANKIFIKGYKDKIKEYGNIKTKEDLIKYNAENSSKPNGAANKSNNNSNTSGNTTNSTTNGSNNNTTTNNPTNTSNSNNTNNPVTPSPTPQVISDEDRAEQEPYESIFAYDQGISSDDNYNKMGKALADFYGAKPEVFADMKMIDALESIVGIFKSNPSWIKANFNNIQNALKTVLTKDDKGNTVVRTTYKLNPDLTISEVVKGQYDDLYLEEDIPLAQDNSFQINEKLIKTLNVGTDKILSGLSLAQLNVDYEQTLGGAFRSIQIDGQLQFSDNDTQINNTNFISVGDTLYFTVYDKPHNFNYMVDELNSKKDDMSHEEYNNALEELYDQVNIRGYKIYKNSVGLEKKIYVGSLHMVSSLDKLLADSQYISKEEEKRVLRENRKFIIEAEENSVHEFEVIDKGFGRINTNSTKSLKTINEAMGSDSRVFINTTDNNEPLPFIQKTIISKGNYPNGATLIMVPNETKEGTVWVGFYAAKGKIKDDNKITDDGIVYSKIHETVFKSIKEYLKSPTSTNILPARRYVYTTFEDKSYATLGNKGIWISNKNGVAAVLINDSYFINNDGIIKIYDQSLNSYREATDEDIYDATGEIYFSVNKKLLKDQATNSEYQMELRNSNMIKTNIVPNPVILNKYKDGEGEYGFLENEQQYSYFHQHTLELSSKVALSKSEVIDTIPGLEAEIDLATEQIDEDELTDIDDLFDEPFVDNSTIETNRSFDEPEISVRKKVLVSPFIEVSLQNEMVKALAYRLFTTQKLEGDVEQIKNKDRAAAWIKEQADKYAKDVNTAIAKKLPQIQIDTYVRLANNFRLFNEHFEGLYEKSVELLEKFGAKYDGETDYWDNLEEKGEDNSFMGYADDANSTRDPLEYLPKEVKKLMYFIPKIRLLNPEISEQDKKRIEKFKKDNPTLPVPTYVEDKSTSLNLPTFNSFNDTWEKTLEVTTSKHFSSTPEGFKKLVDELSKPTQAPVVQELAKHLLASNKQVQNSFFRRTVLQKQVNLSSTYQINDGKQKVPDNYGNMVLIKKGVKRITNIFVADRKQGIKAVIQKLRNDFISANTGLIKTEESADGDKLVIDENFAKNIISKLGVIIDTDTNYKVKDKGGYTEKFTDNAKNSMYSIVTNEIGLKISFNAFNAILESQRASKNVVKSLFIDKILGTLSGHNYKPVLQDEDDFTKTEDFGKNDIFKKESSTLDYIASEEFKYSNINGQSGSYYADGKTYYAFTRSNFLSDIYNQIKEKVLDGKDNFIAKKLKNDVFAKTSIILSDAYSNVVKSFPKMFYELGSRNKSTSGDSKMLKEMNPREHELTKLAWFQNRGSETARYFYDTLSDKSTKPTPEWKKHDISNFTYDEEGNIILPNSALELLYSKYFNNEFERINLVIKQNASEEKGGIPDYKKIKGYHGKKGMGQYFTLFYFLNKDILSVDNPGLASMMYEEFPDENGYNVFKPFNRDIKEAIKKEINKNLNKVIAKNKNFWGNKLGLYDFKETYLDKKNNVKTRINLADIVDHDYMFKKIDGISNFDKIFAADIHYLYENDPKGYQDFSYNTKQAEYYGDWSALNEYQLNKIVDFIATDYVYNYTVFSNEQLLLTGDPAQAGKGAPSDIVREINAKYKDNPKEIKKKTLLAAIEATFINLGKRNAAFLASGERGLFRDSYYNVAIAEDILVDSEHYTEYVRLFGDAAKDYKDKDARTDAQEFTTVKEFLENMLAFSKINEDFYNKALYIYDREQYNEDLALKLVPEVSLNREERIKIANIVFQPQKPVQRSSVIDEDLKISKQYYIKTSAFPLIPDLLSGSMKDLLNDMKAKNIQRVAFVSGVKQGVAGSKQIFNKDGSYNKDFFVNNVNELHRDGFRIQLEIPFDDYHNHIREGTQQSKILFVDIHDDVDLTYRGEATKASDLKNKYLAYHRKIVEKQTSKFLKEIGADPKNLKIKDLRKLSEILQEEGFSKGIALNSLLGLDLVEQGDDKGQFVTPLTFLANSGQIQPILSALISNRITRLKMPGKSYIQASEFWLNMGRKGSVVNGDNLGDFKKELAKDNREIIWTKPEYENLEKLSYLHKGKDGKIKPAQIIMPFYFVDEHNHKVLRVEDYLVRENGRSFLDTSKIDPELLQMNGFRIPFQGLNSGMWFEIVGFLPHASGDMVVVPSEIAVQMGSDYDVDKLYAYMYNYIISDNNINKNNKIIWGHPAIGKSYAAKKTKIIDFDSYKLDINRKYNLYMAPGLSDAELRTDDKTREAREKWRYESEENQELWNQFIRDTWQQAKLDAEEQNAILFASDLLVLREFGNEINKALTMPDNLFFERSKQRNNYTEGPLGTKVWKTNLNKAVSDFEEKYGKNKVLNTDKYLSDILESLLKPNYQLSKVDNSNPESIEELQNALIDIQKSIYTSDDEDIYKAILEPLSFDDIEQSIIRLGLRSKEEFTGNYDPMYQHKMYFSGSMGKTMTAISANANTNHALAQVSNLFIKGEGILILNEDGTPYSDFMEEVKSSNLATKEDIEEAKKIEYFEQVMNVYKLDLSDKTEEFYDRQMEQIGNAFKAYKWKEQTKDEKLYKHLESLLNSDKTSNFEDTFDSIDILIALLKLDNGQNVEYLNRNVELDTKNSVNKIYKNTYEYTVIKGNYYYTENNNYITYKDKTYPNHSAWRLDKVFTFDINPRTGLPYRISNLISQVLGISVDNAKEQKLGDLNINLINANVALLMIRLGFGPDPVGAFINQPILLEYYKLIGETDDIYKTDFTSNKKQKVVDNLFKKYSEYLTDKNIQDSRLMKPYKVSQLVEQINKPIDNQNAEMQLYILKMFLSAKEKADGIQTLSSSFNIDAKGTPKNMVEISDKAESIRDVHNSSKASLTLGNTQNYQILTIPGLFANIPDMAVKMFMNDESPLFAYNSPAYKFILTSTLHKIGREKFSQEKMDTFINNVKEFVYSGFASARGIDIKERREELLLDTDTNKSLQTRFIELRNKYPKNDFLGAIDIVASLRPEDPKLLDLPSVKEEDYLTKVVEYWMNTLYTHVDPDMNSFAKDFVDYALFVNPKEYGISNILKYVPFDYAQEIGLSKYLRDINKDIEDESIFSLFPDQFVQHNPDILLSAKEENVMTNNGKLMIVRNSEDDQIIESFVLPPLDTEDNRAESLIKSFDDEPPFYPEWLAMFNNKKIGKQIYKGVMDENTRSWTYYRYPIKGQQSMSEYDMYDDDFNTIIRSKNINIVIPEKNLIGTILKAEDDNLLNENTTKELQGPRDILDETNVDNMLAEIIKESNDVLSNPSTNDLDRSYAEMYNYLAVNLMGSGMSDKVYFVIDNKHYTVASTSIENDKIKITINKEKLNTSSRTKLSPSLEKQRVILHELLHAKTFLEKDNVEAFNKLKEVWNTFRDNINKSKDKIRGINANVFDAELFKILFSTFKSEFKDDISTDLMLAISDDSNLEKVLKMLEDSLKSLYSQGKIPEANYDLFLNKSRKEDIKDYIKNNLLSKENIKSNINKYYGYYHIMEFITEVLTNPETQELVKNMPTMWEKFVRAFKDLMAKIFKTDYFERTLLDDSIEATFNFLKIGQKELSLQFQKHSMETQGYMRKTYSDNINVLADNQIFVFGSNPIGINGNLQNNTGGAALAALKNNWVIQGEKMDNRLSSTGKSWGITTVTKPGAKRSKSKYEIQKGIKEMYAFARNNPDKELLVAYRAGTVNLNGYSDKEMAEMFNVEDIPTNVIFEDNFSKLLAEKTVSQQSLFEISIDDATRQINELIEQGIIKNKCK